MIPGKSARGCSARGVHAVLTNTGVRLGVRLEARDGRGVWVNVGSLRVAEGWIVRTAAVDDGGREVCSLMGAGVRGLQPVSRIAANTSNERPLRKPILFLTLILLPIRLDRDANIVCTSTMRL